ncbi:MAG: IS3 family transposase, partial [Acidobacteria bacterium]|nr:IS3 family transposase [Acidobacteriota bacterium]
TAAIADYIETFYNRSRRHSHLGGVSPEQFEAAHKSRKQGAH